MTRVRTAKLAMQDTALVRAIHPAYQLGGLCIPGQMNRGRIINHFDAYSGKNRKLHKKGVENWGLPAQPRALPDVCLLRLCQS